MMMRSIVVGLGIQGNKRRRVAGSDCVATVDPVQEVCADYRDICDVPLHLYEAACVCSPDGAKLPILEYLLLHRKHVLVEKPLLAPSLDVLRHLRIVAETQNVACYTAYNHRFEPHCTRMRQMLESQKLGKIYRCRLFYGNGTARDVRNSFWRDQHGGVLTDLGSHLLDLLLYWFPGYPPRFTVVHCHRFENKSPDHVLLTSQDSEIRFDLEMSLLSWRNHFSCDVIGEKGSAHIDSLCKWGPSRFTWRERQLPSGVPVEQTEIVQCPDPTWELEYAAFCELCRQGSSGSNLDNDYVIQAILQPLVECVTSPA